MKFAQLNSQLFAVLNKLAQQDLPFKAAYRIKKIIEKLEKEGQTYENMRLELLKKFAKTNESGELVRDEGNNATFEDGKLEEFQKAFTEMALTDVDSDLQPIPLDLLEKANLTAQEVSVLSSLLAE